MTRLTRRNIAHRLSNLSPDRSLRSTRTIDDETAAQLRAIIEGSPDDVIELTKAPSERSKEAKELLEKMSAADTEGRDKKLSVDGDPVRTTLADLSDSGSDTA